MLRAAVCDDDKLNAVAFCEDRLLSAEVDVSRRDVRCQQALTGQTYSHVVDLWVAYRYWQNKFGLDHNLTPGVCTVAATGQSTNTQTSLSSPRHRENCHLSLISKDLPGIGEDTTASRRL